MSTKTLIWRCWIVLVSFLALTNVSNALDIFPKAIAFVRDEGTTLVARLNLNFTGAGVSCSDDSANNETDCTISGGGGGGHTIQNEGSDLTSRTGLNFVGGGVDCVDDAGNDQTDCTIATQTSALLSSTHTDTSAASVVRGDIIRGNSTPAWERLAIGSKGFGLLSDGTDAAWGAVATVLTKGSSQSSIGTSYTDITGLTTTVAANRAIAFKCHLVYQSTGTTNGIGLSQNSTGGTGPGYDTLARIQNNANDTGSTDAIFENHHITADGMTVTSGAVNAANTSYYAEVLGFFYAGTSGTATWSLRAKSEGASGATVSVMVFSHCWIAYLI
jgi:hypothetical protein